MLKINSIKGLRNRWLMIITAYTLIVIAFVTLYLIPRHEAWTRTNLTDNANVALEQLSASLIDPLLTNEYAALYDSINGQIESHRQWLRLRVKDDTGLQVYPLTGWQTAQPNQESITKKIKFMDKELGEITVITDFDAETRKAKGFYYTLLYAQALMMLLLALAMYFLLDRCVIEPLRGLISAARGMAAGNFDLPLPLVADNEVGDTVAEFSEMRDSIQQQQSRLIELTNEAQNANRAKSDFLSSVSHELRTPLNAILGFAELGKVAKEASDLQKENCQSIHRAGEHLLSIVNSMLDLAAIEAGSITISNETVSLTDVFGECLPLIEMNAKDKGVSIKLQKFDADNTFVLGDHTRVKQVLLNLLTNAVNYNKRKGCVTIKVSKQKYDKTRISITDEGPGLSPEQIEELFIPFNRLGADSTTITGTGIGLTITKELVELMCGEIGVSSEVGKGSTFWVDLNTEFPLDAVLDDEFCEAYSKHYSEENKDKYSNRILIVEDNPVNQILLKQQLLALGYRCSVASDGVEGLKAISREAYDIVLTDIQMPNMNGKELLLNIRNLEDPTIANLPVIACTANAMKVDLGSYIDLGFDSVLSKPASIKELDETLLRFSS